jgi:hypothetical protein
VSIDIGHDEAVTAAEARASMAADFRAAETWMSCDLNALIPDEAVIPFPVPRGLDHDQKLAWLERVAASWRTVTVPDGAGGRKAEKRFGKLAFTAGVGHPDASVAGYAARARSARPESPAAA